MTPLAQAISEALMQFVWQGFLVSLTASIAAGLFRRAIRLRVLIYCAAMMVLAALPVITAIEVFDPLSANSVTQSGAAVITLTIHVVWNGDSFPLAACLRNLIDIGQPWILPAWLAGVRFRLAMAGGAYRLASA